MFPTGTFNVPIVVNDTYGFSVLGNMTIQVIPAGSPIFQGFSSTPSAGFSTSGGDLVQIAAANLIGTSSLNATYQLSSPTLNISYATTVCTGWPCFLNLVGIHHSCFLQNCTVLSSSSAQCYTVPGVGSGLSWTLSFGGSSIAIGQTVGPTAISYNPPVITGVTRASGSGGLSSLRTIGGDVIVVTGTNFGPDCNYTSAWFGSGWVLSLVSCNVTTLVLTTPSGAGAGYLLTVSIGGQTNTFNGATLSYAPPTVSALLGDTVLPTTGFNTQLGRMGAVTILGSNFGPNSTALTVTYSAGELVFRISCDCICCTVRFARRDHKLHCFKLRA